MKSLLLFLSLLGQINDSSFEQAQLASNSFKYGPTDSAWTYNKNAGVASNNSGFDNLYSPNGVKVCFLQGNANISQTITITSSDKYYVTFYATQRAKNQQDFSVSIDKNIIGTFKPINYYNQYITNMIPLSKGDHLLEFQGINTAGGDNTAFIDWVSITINSNLNNIIGDPSFEQVKLPPGTFKYNAIGSSWTFKSSILITNNCGFTGPLAVDGTQACALQGGGNLNQTITITNPGNYAILFYATQRTKNQQDFSVSIDKNIIGTFKPSVVYVKYTTDTIPLSTGDHLLEFQGLNTVGGDNTAFVDWVSITTDSEALAATKFKTAWTGSSGKTIAIQYDSTLTNISVNPTLFVNGNNIGQLQKPWVTGYHSIVLFSTPNNSLGTPYQIRSSDTIQLSAPYKWASSVDGFSGSINNAQVTNKTNQPLFANVPKNLRVGVNNNQYPYSFNLGHYSPTKNLAFRMGWWPGNKGKIQASGSYQLSDITPTYSGSPGLWLVMWDGASIFSLSSTKGTVTERIDLQSYPADKIGNTRVFDIQGPNGPFNINLVWDTTKGYDNLWIVQPGDWELIDGKVILDRSDKFAISPIYLKRVGNNVGSMRWVDSTITGGNPASFPYPEYLTTANDVNWGVLSFVQKTIGYTQAGPATEPFIYSPFFPSYPGTLNSDITTTPSVDTKETWDISSDVLMVGLEIKVDNEIARIVSGSGNKWTVNRGSNGTIPATHTSGSIAISGRRASPGLSDAISFTCSIPHNITTGNIMHMNGTGWPNMAMTDGSSVNFGNFARQVYVTGTNTFFLKFKAATLKQIYNLDPTKQFCDQRYSSGIPFEAVANITGKFPKANLHVNVPIDACDDLVIKIAKIIKANFLSGRKVYVEYSNEPWNWAFSGAYYHAYLMGPLVVPGNPFQFAHYSYRAAQVHKIFRNVFNDRSNEIVGILNCQMSQDPTDYLKMGDFDAIAIAPYYQLQPTPYNVSVANIYDDEQLIDMLTHDLWYNSKYINSWVAQTKSYIKKYNDTNNKNVFLYSYEGGIEFVDPRGNSNITNFEVRNRSCNYNKNFYYHEMDFYQWLQYQGFQGANVYGIAFWWAPQSWGLYHTMSQLPGRGDGLNGDKLNVGTSDLNDSVRGAAFVDWNYNIP